ncbi:hypothetical protein BD779DRAFT_1578243 [Infundibulicybe gibba]|nr:hypothetical protein BD779DRAFT_1578243 [Infundibulicybe gibba]
MRLASSNTLEFLIQMLSFAIGASASPPSHSSTTSAGKPAPSNRSVSFPVSDHASHCALLMPLSGGSESAFLGFIQCEADMYPLRLTRIAG